MCGSMRLGRSILHPGQMLSLTSLRDVHGKATSRFATAEGVTDDFKMLWAPLPWSWLRLETLLDGRLAAREPRWAIAKASDYWERGAHFVVSGAAQDANRACYSGRYWGIAVATAMDPETNRRLAYVVTRRAHSLELEAARMQGKPEHDRHPLFVGLPSGILVPAA